MQIRKIIGISLFLFVIGVQAVDYKPLHDLLIRFYGYQRAGDKDRDSKNPFYTRTPFPHAGDNHQGKDVSGGWYDAGDFVKFGLPLGFSAYCLLKGYDVFPRGYDDANSWDYKGSADGIPDILGEAKIATDYLLKAVISDGVLVVDVGNGVQDHQQWQDGYANSQRLPNRQAYAGGGADVAGLYAASLALMSTLYKSHDAAYAGRCLAKAREAFKFGLLNKKLAQQQTDPNLGNAPYYSNKSWQDKMACGAIELYRASGEKEFLTWAKQFQAEVKSHFYVLGYANVGDLAAFELQRQGESGFAGTWLADVNLAMRRVVTASNASPLIRGAFINSDWGNARNAGNAAFSAALAFMATGESQYKDFAVSQSHWVAGLPPFSRSYIVGYNNGPKNPHHRNASTMGIQVKGGVVSGPSPQGNFDANKPESSNWTFTDSRDIYQNTEVAIDYNAGIIGALAFIRDYENPPAGMVRVSQAIKASPDAVDLNVGPVVITMGLATSISWKVTLTGKTSGAVKSYEGKGAAISVTWAGEADAGIFAAGENVEMKLNVPGIAPYHLSLAKGSFYVKALKIESFRPEDIVLDDFDDGNVTNRLGGNWISFGDKAEGGTSYTNPPTMGPTAITPQGMGATKALLFRMIGAPGAAKPYAGVKSTFNGIGTAISLGAVKSVVFDVKGASGGIFHVELEQSDIADGAHHSFEVKIGNDQWNRLRIPIAQFAQPAWKKASKPLNLGSILSLRFTYFGIGNTQVTLDNVRIEGLKTSGASIRTGWRQGRLAYLRGYSNLPADGSLEFFNPMGKTVSPSSENGRIDMWFTTPVLAQPNRAANTLPRNP